MLGFDSYADMSDHLDARSSAAAASRRTPPATAGRCCPCRRPRGRARPTRSRPRRHGRLPAGARPTPTGRRVVRGAARRPAVGAAEDRQRLRPAVLVLRDPDVPRRRSCRAGPPTSLAEARWLAERGVREVFLVSENSTSYGKDLGDLRPARDAAARAGRRRRASSGSGSPTCSRPRSGPACSTAMASPPGSCRTSTCRSSTRRRPLLRRMRRFGGTRGLPRAARAGARPAPRRPACAPTSSSASPVRPRPTSPSSSAFLEAARLDVVGVFGYSDEDGTEARGPATASCPTRSSPSASSG